MEGAVVTAVKQAIDEDDAQQLSEVLQQNAKMGGIESIIDNLYDGFRGRSCLHRACERGKIKCCRKLLEFGASPNVMPRQGSSNEVQMGPLHVALLLREQECVSALLNHKLVRVDLPDSTGKTPMHVAAGIGYEWGVKALLDANADPSIKDKMNRSVVEYAMQKGKLICVQAITSIHEAVTCLQTQRDEVAQTAASPLEKAVKQAMNEDDAQQLYEVLQQHAKMGRIDLIIDNLYEGFKGRSCLHRACVSGKIKCCRKLLELGASPNVLSWQESSNEVRMGPLHMALQFARDPYRQECVSALLNHKLVRVDLPDSTGKTPMHVAAGIGYEWGVKALLDANADPSIKDKMNRSVVEYAEQKGKRSCVQAIHEAVTSLQTQRDEVAQAAASPFAPFLQEGDQTSPESKGLSQVVYHQVQWLLLCRLIHESDISDTVKGYLRSSDTCLLLSALKDYENEKRCPSKAFKPLEQALRKELSQGRILNGTWQGLVPRKNFGWIRVHGIQGEQNTQDFGSRNFGDAEIIEQLNSFYSQFNPTKVGQAEDIWKIFETRYKGNAHAELNKALAGNFGHDLNTWKAKSEEASPEPKISVGFYADQRRVWCHKSNVRDEDITEGSEVTFQLQQRNGREEASMVQAFNPAALDRCKCARAALCSTRGGDWLRDSRPIAPKLLMMSYDEARIMLEMGCCVQENVETPHLDKIFVLSPCAQGLPPVDDIFSTSRFEIAKAQNCSKALNDMKSRLDEKDIQMWKAHTKKTLLNKDVTLAVRDRVRAEMCTIAFLKMYEMLAAYDLVVATQDMNKFNTLHLCEAPGSFICATNHYIQSVVKKRFPHISWDWVACWLNPYFEGSNSSVMVEADGFINETPENWFFGQDNSGDMRLPHNISATWGRADTMGQVFLVTADGGIDCAGSPNEQEEVSAQLHYCEAVTAIGALAVGGAFVLKMFTLFEHSSICLVHLLSGFFEYTSICKPTMSTPGNSETYIVCKGFKGVDDQYKLKLLSFTGKDWPKSHDGVPLALVPEESISKAFMKNMLRGAEYFARLQGAVISRNLRLFDEFPQQEGRHIADARRLIVGEWIRRFQIVPIDEKCKIVPTPASEPLFDEGLNIPQWLPQALYGKEATRSLLGIRIYLDNINGFAGTVISTVLSVDSDNRLYNVQLDGNSTSKSMKPPLWGWTEEQERKEICEKRDLISYWVPQSEQRLGEDLHSKAYENHRQFVLGLSGEGYVSAELKPDDRKGFSSAHVVITNQGRALMLVQRLKKANGEAKLILGLTGGQRKFIEKENAWACACREADEETGGYAEMCSRVSAPPAHVAWLGINQSERSKGAAGKVVYMYETADRFLAERIQDLRRPPEGRQGLFPPEGAPLTAVWVPLARLRDKWFQGKYLPRWAQDDMIWIDLAKCDTLRGSGLIWRSVSWFWIDLAKCVTRKQEEAHLRQVALDAHARRSAQKESRRSADDFSESGGLVKKAKTKASVD